MDVAASFKHFCLSPAIGISSTVAFFTKLLHDNYSAGNLQF